MFIGEDGMPITEGDPRSEATFSNLNPDTSEADALGGDSTRVIWGTNISILDSMSAFKNFLYSYARKYRMWAEGMSEDETKALGTYAEDKEYIDMLNTMRQLGINGLNLDVRNLKAYPATLKLWHQLHAYPQEIIPLMDQSIKDVMIELAVKEHESTRSQQNRRNASRARNGSSIPPIPDSDIGSDNLGAPTPTPQAADAADILEDVETRIYKVLPFGLDKTINMRELDPAGMYKINLYLQTLTIMKTWISWSQLRGL